VLAMRGSRRSEGAPLRGTLCTNDEKLTAASAGHKINSLLGERLVWGKALEQVA